MSSSRMLALLPSDLLNVVLYAPEMCVRMAGRVRASIEKTVEQNSALLTPTDFTRWGPTSCQPNDLRSVAVE